MIRLDITGKSLGKSKGQAHKILSSMLWVQQRFSASIWAA
jgi:hypothetical protein